MADGSAAGDLGIQGADDYDQVASGSDATFSTCSLLISFPCAEEVELRRKPDFRQDQLDRALSSSTNGFLAGARLYLVADTHDRPILDGFEFVAKATRRDPRTRGRAEVGMPGGQDRASPTTHRR